MLKYREIHCVLDNKDLDVNILCIHRDNLEDDQKILKPRKSGQNYTFSTLLFFS
jgi:hypothetical protein